MRAEMVFPAIEDGIAPKLTFASNLQIPKSAFSERGSTNSFLLTRT